MIIKDEFHFSKNQLLIQLNELIATIKTVYEMQSCDCTQDGQLPDIIKNLQRKITDIHNQLKEI